MPFLWLGTILVLLKWFQLDPVDAWPWWRVLLPFLGSLLWFEWLEQALGKNRRNVDQERTEKHRRKRILAQFGPMFRRH